MDENGNGQFVEETEDPIVGASPPSFEDEEETIVPDNSYESVDGFGILESIRAQRPLVGHGLETNRMAKAQL